MTRRFFPNRLQEKELESLHRMRARYSRRKSWSGILLNEIENATTLEERTEAAWLFSILAPKRGLARLEPIVEDLRRTVEAQTDEWIGPPERRMLYNILYAAAQIDTVRSHALLVHVLHDSPSHLVRADVLEAITFEAERYDIDLILPFVTPDASTPEILSALYALEYKDYGMTDDARERIGPLLTHPYPLVRAYSINVLRRGEANLDLIQTLADDPHPNVRTAFTDAINWPRN